MILYNGERVTLSAGSPTVETMGVSLGRIMRFAGHTKTPYSVLAHSFVVAALMPMEIGIHGLMHDTPELMVSDVPTPMKSQVARNREKVLLERIYVTHGLPWPIPERVLEAVEEADHMALIAEAHILGHPGAEDQWGTEFNPIAGSLTRRYMHKTFEWMDAEKASAVFARKFKEYFKAAGLDQPGKWA